MKKKLSFSPSAPSNRKNKRHNTSTKRRKKVAFSKRSTKEAHKKRLIGISTHKISRKQRIYKRFLRDLFLALVGGSILAFGLSQFFVTTATVHNFSMVPTLREGDKVLIRKTNEVHRFDLVAFTIGDGRLQIRRVIGLPGETIEYTADTLYVNDRPVDEKFLVSAINESQKNGRNYTEDFGQKTKVIPEQYYFVLGDNRPYATDSRHYGLVVKERILGVVTTQLFPFNEIKAF